MIRFSAGFVNVVWTFFSTSFRVEDSTLKYIRNTWLDVAGCQNNTDWVHMNEEVALEHGRGEGSKGWTGFP